MPDPFLLRALLAGLGLAIVAAPLGCFVVWRRMAYYGETVAQAGLIGVALGLAFSFNLTASVLIVTLVISLLLVVLGRQHVVPFDSLLGLLAHASLAIGVIAASLVRGQQIDRWRRSVTYLQSPSAICADRVRRCGGTGGATFCGVRCCRSVHEDWRARPARKLKLVFVLARRGGVAIKIVGALLTIAFDHAGAAACPYPDA